MKVETVNIQYKELSLAVKAYVFMPEADVPGINGGRLRVEIESASGVPSEVFLSERQVVEENNEQVEKIRNIAVAKVADMFAFQANAVDPNSDLPPFFRTSWFDMVFRSPEDMLITWTDIKIDLSNLLKTYRELAVA